MDERQEKPSDVPTGERMKHMADVKASTMGHKIAGERRDQKGASQTLSMEQAQALIEEWPSGPATAARNMLERYGPPNEGTSFRLIWYGNGPWKRTEVTSDEIVHNFPTPHTDFLTQWINYRVPPERFDDLALFDGSCLADRTAGEAGARCDAEAANFLTLNLMHEILTGQRTIEEARQVYAQSMAAYTLGRPAPYTEKFLFELPAGDTTDPDEKMMSEAMMGCVRQCLQIGGWQSGAGRAASPGRALPPRWRSGDAAAHAASLSIVFFCSFRSSMLR